jgi:hypothetical protein
MPYSFEQAAAISKMISRDEPDAEQRAKARVEKLVRAVHTHGNFKPLPLYSHLYGWDKLAYAYTMGRALVIAKSVS